MKKYARLPHSTSCSISLPWSRFSSRSPWCAHEQGPGSPPISRGAPGSRRELALSHVRWNGLASGDDRRQRRSPRHSLRMQNAAPRRCSSASGRLQGRGRGGTIMSRVRRAADFEWTFSTRVRERRCHACASMTSGFLTNLRTGVRKPFCSTCFFFAVKEASPSSAPHKQPESALPAPIRETEQLRLC